MPDDGLLVARLVGWLRLGVGAGLAVAPRSVVRLGSRDVPSGDMVLMTRTVGIRDLALGLGTVRAIHSRSQADSRRWMLLSLSSDLLDIAAGATSLGVVGRRGALIAALSPVPFVAAGLFALAAMKRKTER